GLYLTAQVFLDPGDVVLVESPTFVQTLETFQLMEAEIVACECDKDGFVLDKLEADIIKYKPKLIYVIPTFQNPSGNTTSAERRKALAELAAKYDVLVLEDDPYSEMRYSGEELKPVKYYDKAGHVIYANSFSKIFSPGSRLGYVYAEGDVIDRMYDVKTATNAHTAVLSQGFCAEYFKRGNYPAHLKYIRDVHRERRDAMLKALEELMPEGVSWTYPDGGLFTWLKVPEHISTSAMFEEVKAAGVTYLPGVYFYAPGQPQKDCYMRLSFSSNPPEVLREAVRRLAGVIKTKMQ
ncbi:MAG TPA: PLP-dependent aminotransferase family protein, partial [Terriglobales bacterium]|nr:PLP-dependent aminotransferase family protein [Terriglobales bacterium]